MSEMVHERRFERAPRQVRYAPDSRRIAVSQQTTLRARNRLLHRNKFGEVQRVKSGLLQQDGGAKRPFSKSLSGVQLVEQRLSLLQIERVETFGEAAVDGG